MIYHALKDEGVEMEALEKAERIYGLHHYIHIKPAKPYSATGGSVAMTLNCHCPTEDGDREHLTRAGTEQKSQACLRQSGSDG